MRTVWIYVDTRYLPGHPDYLKVFANPVAADEWCKENDSEGVAFEYSPAETLTRKNGSWPLHEMLRLELPDFGV